MKSYKYDMHIPLNIYDRIVDYLNGEEVKPLADAPFFCHVLMKLEDMEPGFVVQFTVLRLLPDEKKAWTSVTLFHNKKTLCLSKGKAGRIGGVYTVYDTHEKSKATIEIKVNVLRGTEVAQLDRN